MILSLPKIACMRQVPFEVLKAKALELNTYFAPTTDGRLVHTNEEYIALSANRSFPRIPTWFSNADREASLLVAPYSAAYPPGTTEEMAMDGFVCPEGPLILLLDQ